MARSTETGSRRAGRAAAAAYWAARRLWETIEAGFALARAVFNGFWLGLLSRETLHRVDRRYYDLRTEYGSTEHNLQGLFDWEERAIQNHFAGVRSLLVLGAGGGREVLALRRLGFDVDGCECHPGLREAANCLLAEHGDGELQPMEHDLCPPLNRRYDGVIVGWAAYMLVQGRARRVHLVRDLRALTVDGAPLLLSFFTRDGGERQLRLTFLVARALRRLLRREPPDLGDTLSPNFFHCFTRDEVAGELDEAGWVMEAFVEQPYPHAVARAVTRPQAG